MTFIRKHSGDSTKSIVAVYMCEEHGEFDAEVQREQNGEAPDSVPCDLCAAPATWTPSVVGCRVRRVEVTRGKWEKPERKTYLDTRKLGEGQDVEEFQAERQKVWRDKRMQELKDL